MRAFNSVGFNSLRSETNRAGDKVAIPLAGDDAAALEVAKRLVVSAGFEPVVVGGLAKAKDFDPGTPAFGKAMTAAEFARRSAWARDGRTGAAFAVSARHTGDFAAPPRPPPGCPEDMRGETGAP